jgi:hypothetical protein
MIGIVCDPRPRRGRTEGRGRTFESCRAHGSTKPFSRDRNAEKCTIRPSYSASVRTRGADEPCPEGAGGEGLLGLPDRGPGGVGTSEDGLLQDRPALVARLPTDAPSTRGGRSELNPRLDSSSRQLEGRGRPSSPALSPAPRCIARTRLLCGFAPE